MEINFKIKVTLLEMSTRRNHVFNSPFLDSTHHTPQSSRALMSKDMSNVGKVHRRGRLLDKSQAQ